MEINDVIDKLCGVMMDLEDGKDTDMIYNDVNDVVDTLDKFAEETMCPLSFSNPNGHISCQEKKCELFCRDEWTCSLFGGGVK